MCRSALQVVYALITLHFLLAEGSKRAGFMHSAHTSVTQSYNHLYTHVQY